MYIFIETTSKHTGTATNTAEGNSVSLVVIPGFLFHFSFNSSNLRKKMLLHLFDYKNALMQSFDHYSHHKERFAFRYDNRE